MKKIIVIGSGGAGKSTFSKRLGNALEIEVIHLDQQYWKPGWGKTPVDEWETIVKQILEGESWIIDGNFGGTREIRLKACDTVIFLDTPRYVCIYRVLKRSIQFYGRSRPDMTAGCDESFDLEFLLWIWNYPNKTRPGVYAQMEKYSDKNIVTLRKQSEVKEFLDRFC